MKNIFPISTALALVGVLRLKVASVRGKSEDWTYSDFPIKSCTSVSNSRDIYMGRGAYTGKP